MEHCNLLCRQLNLPPPYQPSAVSDRYTYTIRTSHHTRMETFLHCKLVFIEENGPRPPVAIQFAGTSR
ncbi:hypothetical protein B0H10DRAFT_1976483 [Mycena sp. CBHHK59/15]|nr:hypothetical protein B0H10DRAFT_1976483 [Mycena sp. CBHHK59/15]